jgi:translation initiation factor RLI1
VMDRAVADLSGGELQRFATAVVCIQASAHWKLNCIKHVT